MEIKNGKIRKPELLIPASSLEVLKTAVIYGADAVYIGGEAFGLRAKAKNFSMEDMAEGIAFAHKNGVKVYVTANILAHNEDLEGAGEYFAALRDMKPEPCDALIISDPGMVYTGKGGMAPGGNPYFHPGEQHQLSRPICSGGNRERSVW